jgi:hypothetical protein
MAYENWDDPRQIQSQEEAAAHLEMMMELEARVIETDNPSAAPSEEALVFTDDDARPKPAVGQPPQHKPANAALAAYTSHPNWDRAEPYLKPLLKSIEATGEVTDSHRIHIDKALSCVDSRDGRFQQAMVGGFRFAYVSGGEEVITRWGSRNLIAADDFPGRFSDYVSTNFHELGTPSEMDFGKTRKNVVGRMSRNRQWLTSEIGMRSQYSDKVPGGLVVEIDSDRVAVIDAAGSVQVVGKTHPDVDHLLWRSSDTKSDLTCAPQTAADFSFPEPTRSGALWKYLRLAGLSADQVALTTAWAIEGLLPNSEFPILFLQSRAGSGKTTTARALNLLLGSPAWNVQAWNDSPQNRTAYIANTFVATFDNLSKIKVADSDWLCTVASDGESRTRKLYSNNAEVSVRLGRPTIITCISLDGAKGDLLTRFINIELDARNRVAKTFDPLKEMEALLPEAQAELLAAVGMKLAAGTDKKARKITRFGSFNSTVALVDSMFKTAGADLLMSTVDALKVDALGDSIIATKVFEFLRDQPEGHWAGTPGQLAERLDLPSSVIDSNQDSRTIGKRVASQIKQNAAQLEAVGVTFKDSLKRTAAGVQWAFWFKEPTAEQELPTKPEVF